MYTKLLSNILYCSKEKQSVLLGLIQSKNNPQKTYKISTEGKTVSQIDAIEGAINSKDYFLIQGPPGTGKTSVVLAEIVKNIIENTSETILIIAYTNKVVDELCSLVLRLGFGELMVRMGSTTNTEITPYVLSQLVSSVEVSQISTLLAKKRICISTVASIASNSEVLLFWKFQTAIFDEAAQIVEAFCTGIASFCERCIFIGDEKQLPAIVVQPKESTVIHSSELQSIGLHDLSESLFSRLLHNAKKNNWTECFSLLREQGRMHKDIQRLSNELFYQNMLTTLTPQQNTLEQRFGDSPFLQKSFQSSRAIFCDVNLKKNTIETEILLLLERYIEQFIFKTPNLSIGIITPFRKFNHTIVQHFASKNVDFIDVDTVERFQGSERDIIFYCIPVTTSEQLSTMQSIGIIDGISVDRKLNVAITRAKEYFVLCGSSEILHHSEQYSQLLQLLPTVQWQ
jgi:DNA replication ATP-dependent helicase Dna2